MYINNINRFTDWDSFLVDLHFRFSKSRPGLSVCIFPLLHDDIKDVPKYIPAKHFNELTRFSSNIASLPSNMS